MDSQDCVSSEVVVADYVDSLPTQTIVLELLTMRYCLMPS